jgi:hypothetical protein
LRFTRAHAHRAAHGVNERSPTARAASRRDCGHLVALAIDNTLTEERAMMSIRLCTILGLALVGCAGVGGDTPPGPGSGSNPGPGSGSDPGPGSGSDPGGGGTPISATAFVQQVGMHDCDDAFTCMASFPAMTGETFADDFGASQSDCYAMAATYYDPAKVEADVTAGKITFDGQAAADCIAGIAAPTCSTYWTDGPDWPAACDRAMVGTVADGGACDIDFECASITSYCDETTLKCTADTGQ